MKPGPRPAVRLTFLGEPDALRCKDICRELTHLGIDVANRGEVVGWMAEVLVVPVLSDDITRAVREATSFGTRRVLVVTTAATARESIVWHVLAAGAEDVMAWDPAQPAFSARCMAARLERWWKIDEILDSPDVRDQLVGHSGVWVAALRDLAEVAPLSDVPVLITGESGTGKELAARLLHDLDPRPDKRGLVVLDCTIIVPTLSGSEFFGHERGAFTDAVTAREGAFGEADRGTLFLDELGELPLGLQAELLRVVQEGMYKRVGSSLWRRTRFRLICATNRDLREEVAKGRFRSDLYHRLAAWTVRLPSLRERPEDIPQLATHFVRQIRPDLGDAPIDPAVLDVLQQREYPGNVRELRQLVSHLAGRHVGPGPITAGDLPHEERPRDGRCDDDWRRGTLEAGIRRALAQNVPLSDIRKAVGEAAVGIALEESGGKVRPAARRLQVTTRMLQMRRAAARKNRDQS